MSKKNERANQYHHTPRNVFDRRNDLVDRKLARMKEDFRTDLAFLLGRIQRLEHALEIALDPTERKGQQYITDTVGDKA